MPSPPAPRHLLSIADVADDLPAVLRRAAFLKAERRRGRSPVPLRGRTVALIFEKHSTRTRTSFEVAAHDLGGHSLFLSTKDLQLGRGETIPDTARVLSRYVDVLVYRAFRHGDMETLARWSSIPVINALDDREHPCQAVADLLTLHERWKGRWAGRRLAYIGDGNNVLHSLLLGAASVGLSLTAACPKGYEPDPAILREAEDRARSTGATVRVVHDPVEAAEGSDALYTDVWVSMGDEAQQAAREAAFAGFQVNDALLDRARPGAFAMHDLPAHRGQEITDAVMDGPRQAIWDQAENRLHAQKALLEWCVAPVRSRERTTTRRLRSSRPS
ncbi:MAG: ornithine carbamoyltransferase [Thermoplasmata archaeon]